MSAASGAGCLLVRITRRADGSAVLRCERSDGSVTWQVQRGRLGSFFPLHDLTHFAVESELGIRTGFYGLIASGWDIEDTTGKGPRGALPPETVLVERIVGLLDTERGSGNRMSSEEFNTALAGQAGAGGEVPRLDETSLARLRARRAELFARWRGLAPGGSLELSFEASGRE